MLNFIISSPAPALIVLTPCAAVIVSAPPAVLIIISPTTLLALTFCEYVLTLADESTVLNTPFFKVTVWFDATSANLSISKPLTLLKIAISAELRATVVNCNISFAPAPPSRTSSFVRCVDCILNVSFPAPPIYVKLSTSVAVS